MDTEVKVKSLQKAIHILNCFTDKPELGVSELAERLGLCKSNVHNILSTFQALGYVEQNEESGKYCLGIKIFELSRALGDRFSVNKIAAPYMQEIANQTREKVYLAVPREDEVLYLESMHPADDVAMIRSLRGARAKMYCTGLGKALMAFLPRERMEEYAGRPLEVFTDSTITEKEVLLRELEQVKRQGFAVDNMEHEFGVKCVAVPIFQKDGTPCAAISVSGPSLRFDDKRVKELAALLQENSRKISQKI